MTKPTLTELTAKLEQIAAAMGATVESPRSEEKRYRLHLHVYLPSGIPLFFQSDRTGSRYDISISTTFQKTNPVGWAKISEFLEPAAWHESLYTLFSPEVTESSMTVSFDRPIAAIVKAINSKLLKPEIIEDYDNGVAAFVAKKKSAATSERKLREFWDLCSHSDPNYFKLEAAGSQISFFAPGYTRICHSRQGFGVELSGLSEDTLKAVLAAADRLKPVKNINDQGLS